jgi:hypothetical protein
VSRSSACLCFGNRGLVSGIATLIGGFGGAWLVGRQDARRGERRQVREHSAAVLAVLCELTTILFGIALILDHKAYVPIDTPGLWVPSKRNTSRSSRVRARVDDHAPARIESADLPADRNVHRVIDGAMLAGLGDEVTVATADVSHERLAAVRARLPVLAQRRAALSADAPPGAGRPRGADSNLSHLTNNGAVRCGPPPYGFTGR